MLKLQPMHGNLKMKPVRRFMSLVICQHIMVKAEHIVSQVICQKNQCCRNCFSMNRTTKIRPQNQSDSDFFRTLFVTQIGHFLTFKQNNLTFSELGIFFRKSDFYRTWHMLFLSIIRTKKFPSSWSNQTQNLQNEISIYCETQNLRQKLLTLFGHTLYKHKLKNGPTSDFF